jgi:hypothetical protein
VTETAGNAVLIVSVTGFAAALLAPVTVGAGNTAVAATLTAALVKTAAAAAQSYAEVPQSGVNDPAEPGCAYAVNPAGSEENAAIGEDGVRLDLNCSDAAAITTSEEAAKVTGRGAIVPPPVAALADELLASCDSPDHSDRVASRTYQPPGIVIVTDVTEAASNTHATNPPFSLPVSYPLGGSWPGTLVVPIVHVFPAVSEMDAAVLIEFQPAATTRRLPAVVADPGVTTVVPPLKM